MNLNETTVILGIDPGSWNTGYGVLSLHGQEPYYLTSGTIATKQKSLAQRLQNIYSQLQEVVQQHRPAEVAIEQVFVSRNANTALKLGQARGVALLAATQIGASFVEYAPRRIKQSVVGYGAAEKKQVQHMIRSLLKICEPLAPDAADALAVAYCHALSRKMMMLLQEQPS